MGFCTVERDGGLLIVTMNRPETLNAFIPEAHDEMAAIFNAFAEDDALHVAILTGAGRGFCSGSDIRAYDNKTNRPLPPEGGGGLTMRKGLTKPVIAAVNGVAMGGGFEVLLSCDIVIAAEDAKFGLPEVKVGAGALGGGIPRLCRKIPYNIAIGLIVTGDRLSATEAHRLGIVNELAPSGQALEIARRWADRILQAAPLAVRASKRVAEATLGGFSFEDTEALEANMRELVMGSTDFTEGMRAFMEKRAPVWTGR